MTEEYALFVGIDWSKRSHQVSLVGLAGEKLEEFEIEHRCKGLEELNARIEAQGIDPASVAVAIETPHGSVVASCLLRGYTVLTLNPMQLDRFRDRHFPAGSKDDRADAFVLATSIRTDKHCFRKVASGTQRLQMLDRLITIHDDLVTRETALLNQARETLHEYFPQFEAAVGELDSAWCWEVWKLVKSQKGARKASLAKVAKILKKRRVRRITADELLDQLRDGPMPLLPGVEEAGVLHLEFLVPNIELARAQQRDVDRQILGLLEEFAEDGREGSGVSDVELIQSMPGAGAYVTAVLLTQASEELAELDYDRLRSVAGVAPVTRQSGKTKSGVQKKSVKMRRACRPKLRNAVYHLARVAVQRDQRIRARYARIRMRGKTHGHALRSVGDAMLRCLVAMLRERQPWNPEPEQNVEERRA